MAIFSFGVSNSVTPVLTNIEKAVLRDSYLYLAEDSVLTNRKKYWKLILWKKNVLYPAVRGNVKMCNIIINNLLFVESAWILSTHYSLNLLLKLLRSVMSLKKAYDVLRIEASNERPIMHAAITTGVAIGKLCQKRCYSRPSQKITVIVVKWWQLIVYTKFRSNESLLFFTSLHGRKQRWSRKENAIRQINGKFEFLEATRR